MLPRSIDDYTQSMQDCRSVEELFAAYSDEIEREGYQNIVFVRMDGTRERFEVRFANVPEGDARRYFEDRMWEHDPVLTASQEARSPFTWIEEMVRKPHSQAARRIMELKAAIGIQGGLTMPFHGPGGMVDIFSLSMRDQRLLNPHRIHLVNQKTYATLQRYLALESEARERATRAQVTLAVGEAAPGTLAHDCRTDGRCAGNHGSHPQHGDCVGTIADDECRALVLVDIAWRRYTVGLIELNKRIPDIIGDGTLRRFVNRGLIDEEPDDVRFEYFFRPSPVGQSHIKTCPCVTSWRNEVVSKYVEVHERPVD